MKIIKNTENYVTEKVDMFGEAEKVLDKIKDERVFSVSINEENNKVAVSEKCDGYFGVYLDSDECRDLAIVFNGLAEHLDNKK